MKLTWIEISCFYIEAQHFTMVMDPFAEKVPFPFPTLSADLVTVSHEHYDHNAAHRIRGNPTIVRAPGVHHVAGREIAGIDTSHGSGGGVDRGRNTIFVATVDGVRFAHCGDLGSALEAHQRDALSDVQVLLIPVGGFYTIDAKQAAEVVESLSNLRVVMPMHYKTQLTAEWPVAPVQEFLRVIGERKVRSVEGRTVTLSSATLPATLEIWVLG